jgi:DNA-binding PadR family transcriptional regulator
MPPPISSLPNSRERHALAALLLGGWKQAAALYPTMGTALTGMVEKGWIERRMSKHIEFRITDAGRTAFRARLPGK